MISSGMNQIRRLSKEVKEEVHDIRRIKGEVTHMKVRLKSYIRSKLDWTFRRRSQTSSTTRRTSRTWACTR